MLFALMKLITWVLSPLALGLLLGGAGGYLGWRGHRRTGFGLVGLACVWLWVWSSPWFYFILGGNLERQYPSTAVDSLQQADAIVVLGGGLGSPTPLTFYPELYPGADRGWHAARCFRAGKAPVVVFSGTAEGPGMRQFLVDLGVPKEKIIIESESKNTYENGVFTREKLKELKAHSIILVTSAWHLRRAIMAFQGMGIKVIPAGCDYEALSILGGPQPPLVLRYLPTPDFLMRNSMVCKEYIGYWAYWIYYRTTGKI